MLSYIELAFAWMLFISLPILAAGMFYRAHKYRSVQEHAAALAVPLQKSYAQSPDKRWQRYSVILNVAAGSALCMVVAAILLFGLSFAAWSASAAAIVWLYFITTRLMERMQRAEAAKS